MDFKKMAIKAVLPLLDDFLPKIDGAVEDYRLSWIEKRPLAPGEDVVCVLFMKEKRMYISVVVISEDNRIIEQLETLLFSDFVQKLVEEFKNSKD
jgi:hypothetical protein